MGPGHYTVQYFTPSYSLYPVLADIHNAKKNEVELNPDFSLPSVEALKDRNDKWSKTASELPAENDERNTEIHAKLDELLEVGLWDFHAALTFITTPNAPSGRGYKTAELEKLCRAQKGVVVLDEAYADFARENAMRLALKFPHVLVARTFSKAYSLCFQRVGYVVGHADLIAALHKIRDSYNVNGLGQIAAEATLADLKYYRANNRKIVATRERLGRELARLGFRVLPSQTNFLLARPPLHPAKVWLQKLRDRKILVRWFSAPEVADYLRITIGAPAEAAALVKAARAIIGHSH